MPRQLFSVAAASGAVALALTACTVIYKQLDPTRELERARVRPGITVLLGDSIGLIRNRRIGLLTNQTGVDEKGRSDIMLLRTDQRARAAGAQLVALFSPEHGLSGKADRQNLPSGMDAASGLPVYSLYGASTTAPPDSVLRGLDAVVIDLQDVGTRTWTYVGAMVYTMRAAARLQKPVIVLDRPNPLTGALVEGPVLDSSLANADDPAPGRPGLAYALYPVPLKHGLTMGELARFFNSELRLGTNLTVVPAAGWRRDVWFDLTGLPFVMPSPNLPSLQSVMVYPGLVAYEGTNLSVGRGTPEAFQRIGAPWLKATEVAALLKQRVRGARFTAEDFTPVGAGDGKYSGQRIRGVRIEVTDRTALQASRLAANILWAINKTSPGSLTIDTLAFDRRLGAGRVRRAILAGEDPDAVIDREYVPAYEFRQRTRRFFLY